MPDISLHLTDNVPCEWLFPHHWLYCSMFFGISTCLSQTVINAEIIMTLVLKYNVLELTCYNSSLCVCTICSIPYKLYYKVKNEILTDIINFSYLTVDLDTMNQNLIN